MAGSKKKGSAVSSPHPHLTKIRHHAQRACNLGAETCALQLQPQSTKGRPLTTPTTTKPFLMYVRRRLLSPRRGEHVLFMAYATGVVRKKNQFCGKLCMYDTHTVLHANKAHHHHHHCFAKILLLLHLPRRPSLAR